MVFGYIPRSEVVGGLDEVIQDVAGGGFGIKLANRLTGTVTKTAGSAVISGAGTAFLSEVVPGDAIKIGVETFTVSSVASDISLTVDSNAASTQSAQIAFGDYNLWGAKSGDGVTRVSINKSGHIELGASVNVLRSGTSWSLLGSSPAPSSGEVGTGAQTLTAAQVLKGVIMQDPEGAATWTMPTAALLVAAVPGAKVGDTAQLVIVNQATAGADEPITIAAGTGGTVYGSAVVEASAVTGEESSGSAMFLVRFTNVSSGSEAYDVIRAA